MLTGTLGRTSGEIRVLGEDPMRFSRDTRGRLAYMPQLFSLYEDLSAQENVGFVAALYGIGPFRRGRLIRRALEVVELYDARHRLARDLSGGMQRRLELACALVHSPDVLFVDEPTAGIDPMLRVKIWDELRALRDQGRTLLVTTQYVTEAEYCDRVALIADGELVAHTTHRTRCARRRSGATSSRSHARGPSTPDMLASVPGITAVRQPAARQLFVTAEDAASTTPQIIETLRGGGRRGGRHRGAPADLRRGVHAPRRATTLASATRRPPWRPSRRPRLMGDLVQGITHSLVRIAAFTTKELREVIRRPGALLSLILGPFLVMALFGLGYSGYRAPFATEIVVPAESDFSRTDVEYYEDLAPGPPPGHRREQDGAAERASGSRRQHRPR